MIALVPVWAHNYEEFWIAIRRRNAWFIQLRYFASIMLFFFWLFGKFIIGLNFSGKQDFVILSITGLIVLYNFVIMLLKNRVGNTPGRFNCLHLSLLQMLLDLFTLTALVFYTGLIDSPLFMFFIFHMIIGSLILPGRVVYTIAVLVSAGFTTLIFMQYYNFIVNYYIQGLFTSEPRHTFNFVAIFCVVFSSMMLISVYLANIIAQRLYNRERQLKETIDKLNETEIAKQKYIMGVVHEIKSPISAVRSLLEIITQGLLGEIGDKIKEKIDRAIIRTGEAIEIINDVLRLSKLKLIDAKMDEILHFNDIIIEVIDKYRDSAATKNIELKYSNSTYDNICIKGDRTLIELAISNLVNNAIKFNSKNGKVEVTLSEDCDSIKISIADDGPGILINDREKIFNQFYRGSKSNVKKEEGSGLGLSMVKEIVQRHGGTIEIDSPCRLALPDRPGTEFVLKIPAEYNQSDLKTELLNRGGL